MLSSDGFFTLFCWPTHRQHHRTRMEMKWEWIEFELGQMEASRRCNNRVAAEITQQKLQWIAKNSKSWHKTVKLNLSILFRLHLHHNSSNSSVQCVRSKRCMSRLIAGDYLGQRKASITVKKGEPEISTVNPAWVKCHLITRLQCEMS